MVLPVGAYCDSVLCMVMEDGIIEILVGFFLDACASLIAMIDDLLRQLSCLLWIKIQFYLNIDYNYRTALLISIDIYKLYI